MNLDKVFAELHAGPDMLILPNAWDAGSARIIEAAGAKAIATSSAAVSWGHGYPDGQLLSFERVIATVEEMVRIVRVPVSADIESGYAATPSGIDDTIARVLDAGAVGVNIEDGVDTPELLCAKIERARVVAAAQGIALWINARVDVYLRHFVPAPEAFAESVRRAALYRSAGADSIFVPALMDRDEIGRMVQAVALPFNVLAMTGTPDRAGAPDARTLRELGVRRLSAGGWLARAAYNRTYSDASSFLRDGKAAVFNSPPITVPPLNELMCRA